MREIPYYKACRSAGGTGNASEGFEETGKLKSCPQVNKTGTTSEQNDKIELISAH
jgi:hypothetical protein